MKARVVNIGFITTGETVLEVAFRENVDLKRGNEIELEINTPKKKRSLNANSYYWKLCRKVCEKVNDVPERYHNRNLADLGIPKRDKNDELIFAYLMKGYDWEGDYEKHYKPLPGHNTDINGVEMELYCELLGSKEFNSKQMSLLIDNVISDCKEMGIETEPKEYVEQLIKNWGDANG